MKRTPAAPNLKEATIGQVIEWARPLADAELGKEKANIRGAAQAAEDCVPAIYYDAPWSWRVWINRIHDILREVPNYEKLEIIGTPNAATIPSDEVPQCRRAVEFLGRELHHLDFKYFTLPKRK